MRFVLVVLIILGMIPFDAKALDILFLSRKFPYTNQMYIINQVTGLIDRGHTVYVLSQQKSDESICSALSNYKQKYTVFYDHLPENKKSFDVVLCQMAELDTWYQELKHQGLKGKSIVFCRGWDVSTLVKQNPHRYDRFFDETDIWLPVCDYFRKRLIKLGYDTRKIQVLGSSVDCKKFTRNTKYKKSERICVVTTARLIPKKGIEYALKAIAGVIERYPQVEYIVIGKGKWKNRLEKLAHDLKIHKNVIFVGHKTHEEVIHFLNNADIYIQPSVTSTNFNQEGIPNALKEAMAMELPVISTYHAGIPELVDHGISGLLVPEKNTEAIKTALLDLIEHTDKRKILGKKAREKVLQVYDIDVINDQLNDVIVSLYEGLHA